MAKLINDAQWERYERTINDAMETFANKEIIWRRFTKQVNRFGEDPQETYSDITLKCLINYNYMRSWPITFTSDSGELDRQSMQVLFSKDYLKTSGYLTIDGSLDYDPAMDRFIIDGLVMKSFGDTPVSQSNNLDLMYSVIVKREETKTGDKLRP